MKRLNLTRILLALLLMATCAIDASAAELNLTCTININGGQNSAQCDVGEVQTDGTQVCVTVLNSNFKIESVRWIKGETYLELNINPDGCYIAPEQSGIVKVLFRLKSDKVKVSFDLNGFDGDTPAYKELKVGQKVTKPSPDPQQEGVEFVGWYLEQEGTTRFDFDAPLDNSLPYKYSSSKLNLTLYAVGGWVHSSGTCGMEDGTHNGSQLTWTLYRSRSTGNADSLVISGNGEMAENAFYQWTQLKTVVIEEGVTTIPANAFYGCSSLTSVTIPASVTTIGQDAFQDCYSLTSVTIPASVTTIGQDAFQDCYSLTSVTIPASVTTICDYAFYGCSSLTSVTIPASVTTICDYAFYGCSSLTSVTIPASVTTIGKTAFGGCSHLSNVNVPVNDYSSFCSNSIVSLIASAINKPVRLIDAEDKEIKEFVIPKEVTTIGEGAFRGCSSLTSVTIPASVTTIGNYAFRGCSSLTSVTIPSSVTTIGNYAFSGCSSLTSVTIPASVTTIGGGAFYGCSTLTSVTIFAPPLETYGSSPFGENASNRKIYVFPSCVDAYKAGWLDYASDIDPIAGTTTLTASEVAQGEYWTSYYNGETDMMVDPNTTTVYTARMSRSGELVMMPVADNVVNKGQGVLLKADRAQIDLCPAPTPSIATYADNALRGTDTNATQQSGTDYYVLDSQGSAPAMVKLPAEATLAEHQAYLPLAAGTAQSTIALVPASDVLAGDANDDGHVDANDITTLVQHLIGLPPQYFCAAAADVNGDNTISIADVVQMVEAVVNDAAISNARMKNDDAER